MTQGHPTTSALLSEPARPAGETPCPRCRGGRRVWVRLGGRIPTLTPVPCPGCRPAASPIGVDGRLKDEAGLAAARDAVRGGA